MTKKIITWVDLEGRYRVTSPAYKDRSRPVEETEDECLERVWARLVAVGGYGIPIDHPHFYVEDATSENVWQNVVALIFAMLANRMPMGYGMERTVLGRWTLTDGPKSTWRRLGECIWTVLGYLEIRN